MKRHKKATAQIAASPEAVFGHLDDQALLGGHMQKPSLMMGGGRMSYEFDAEKGRAIGSRIRMAGSAFGLTLSLDEVVTERVPPKRKAWRTVGRPKLIVVGPYEMGFGLNSAPGGSAIEVWIDYDLPPTGFGRFLPSVADRYAQWCVDQIVAEAVRAFGRLDEAAAPPIKPVRPAAERVDGDRDAGERHLDNGRQIGRPITG